MFLAKVHVSLKPTVNDPQGLTIAHALGRLDFDSVDSVRAGKYFEVKIDSTDQSAAEADVKSMCEKLLANPVIETFTYELESI
ncbi:phosphoribosylformylglycinamidine synthase subunit PurS [Candidatus Lucifugimonas marina]|jgi:phosphoribosylformylglycinamidine synthase|uniref:Phosphoribosylformylglycinamidine synthase subunit PurS n=1 Tax=Candidatus Lucifugimonas marina TaxID=3038979 RepID=A0AAJ5ZFU5_9CHLR|nr:phosphoribosylformylglycinamidine synthase subunit PurS [SAR202 cluster bacterium JH702]MDG0868750.1 phosphoribosylformylglycinamidine synthase subunit PurS [SAR202 cluster bacterium JH639]WFG35382.1 phosphoribosylformylglycinamidine synthase subunit PurS [SAR202 cluster bacterium JH545]WFG39329.1 phosphoribosylformylglycinamidine synthase subunit PurS [SAR202 cluster bacterium JH1073]